MMKPRVYLETTIPSYLTARPSRDIIQAAYQQITHKWWAKRSDFELFVSRLVIDECRAGDAQAAAARLVVLAGIELLREDDRVEVLVQMFVREVPLPKRATADAIHIAVAAVHRIDYLLTWNCAHIANATLRPRIETVCHKLGYQSPIICTPQQFLSEEEISG